MKVTILTLFIVFIASSQADDATEAEQALKDKIAEYVNGCYTAAQDNCETDCSNGVNILHGCLDECTNDSDSLYNITSCTINNSIKCDLSSEQNAKLFSDLQICLINQRITYQCHDDEVFNCKEDEKCLSGNDAAEEILNDSVYQQCEKQLVTNKYFDCFSEQLQAYSKTAQANSDAVSMGQNRISYYQAATLSLNCQEKQKTKCNNLTNKNDCLYNIQVLNGCLDKNCQYKTDPNGQYVCFVKHYESCKTDQVQFNEIVKVDLRCVNSIILKVFVTMIHLMILF